MDMLRSLAGFVRYTLMYAYHLLAFPLIAAAILAWSCTSVLSPQSLQSPFFWIASAPVLYLCWLVLTFAVSALNMQIASRLGWSKPTRSVSEDSNPSGQQIVCAAIMMRAILFWSLPVTRYLLRIPGLCQLVLYSYSPKVSVGKGSQIWGYIYDPDLTTVGEGAILGGSAVVCSHSATADQQGRMVYTTARVIIGPRAIIGGESRIGLGVHIGADVIVEPGSVVPAFSRIPDGEVWAGNPVQFQRHRFEAPTDPGVSTEPATGRLAAAEASRSPESSDASISLTTSSATPVEAVPENETISADDLVALREIIADNLRLPLESLSESPSATEYSEWDSLAQMGIAASIATRFGCVLPAEEVFRLTSLDKLCAVVFPSAAASNSPPEDKTPSVTVTDEEPQSVTNAELLPLLDRSEAHRWLTTNSQPDGDAQRTVSVRIAASFTAEPVATSLVQWCSGFGISAEVTFAGFDQVESTLLLPTSLFRSGEPGINVVLVRPEDLAERPGRAEAMLDAIRTFGAAGAGSLVVGTLPPAVSPFCLSDRGDVEELRAHWRSQLRSMPHVELLEFAAVIERLGTEAARQSDMEVVARSPYSTAAFQELGIELARHLRSRSCPAKKVLALDADNTLWGGVVGEDGIDGIQIGDDHPGRSFKLFQQQVLRLKKQGVLLVLVSRNEERDALQVLDEHPDMLLKRNDFAAWRINWRPKSGNLKELAAELNLGLDSFVFVDDDPANRAEVEQNAPSVTVLPLPEDATRYCETLGALWCFDGLAVSAEDQARTKMMHQQRERDELRSSVSDESDYLASLQLRATMRRATERELPRVAQLTQKTNQFNLSLRRRSLDEIRNLSRESDVFGVSASDRFGDYGLIGVVILKSAESCERLQIDTFLLSCRALGRGLEQLMLQEVVSLASQRKLSSVEAPFETGPRNQPVRDFFDASGLQKRDSAYVGRSLNFVALDTVNWTFSDGHDCHDAVTDVA